MKIVIIDGEQSMDPGDLETALADLHTITKCELASRLLLAHVGSFGLFDGAANKVEQAVNLADSLLRRTGELK